ncbi:MAG: DPP IV N-terminal domain-containing protein, partial [Pirellulales bacterium]
SILVFFCIAVAAARSLFAQGTGADYRRAANLPKQTEGKVFEDRIEAQWLSAGERFWYRNQLADAGLEFVFVDAKSGSRQAAFDHAKLAAALAEKLGRPIDPKRLPVEAIDLTADGKIQMNAAGGSFSFDPASKKLAERASKLPRPSRSRDAGGAASQRYARWRNISPDGGWQVKVVGGNIVARAKNDGGLMQLTEGEKLERVRVYWAPDSKRFVVLHTESKQEHIVQMIESSPRSQLQPRLKSIQYLKPGDKIAITKPRLFDIVQRREIPLDDAMFENPWHIDRLRWAADSSRFTFLYNQRGHQVMRIVAVDADKGKARTLIEEAPGTFVNYFQKLFVYFLDDRAEIIWMSERDGWNHLYRFDADTGDLKIQITRGEWVVRGVDRIDREREQIWFRACGIYPDQDPYHVHFCRINFDGTGLVRLTAGDGTHSIQYSPDRRYFIDKYSRVDLPPVHELRRADDGGLVCRLEEADISQLLAIPGWRLPQRFVAKGRDGTTDIWGVINLPTNFDPAKKYPVVEKIYAGPHGHYVPKSFHAYYTAQQITEVGFVVVVIDGMGTNWRSKKFHDVCWQNLKDAGFPDRIPWIRTAAEKFPYMDISRMGIYGGSAGGQNALGGLLFHPDFYKVAVADCGCHDNRMDKIHWNEAWMGLIGEHYAENSNVTHAHKLRGKLLLTVGELDTNVDPASTMQVVDALIKADKD